MELPVEDWGSVGVLRESDPFVPSVQVPSATTTTLPTPRLALSG